MQVITPELIKDKKVLLRMDLDVPLGELSAISHQSSDNTENKLIIKEDFRLKAALPTLNMCLEHAQKVVIMGHLGRPEGKRVEVLSVAPIYEWLEENIDHTYLDQEKLFLLENLRFESGEDNCDLEYTKELASFGDPSTTSTSLRTSLFINEAFAAHHKASSTTVLPTLLPHFAGLRFKEEVDTLTRVRENPKHPLVAIIGGVKVEDKYQAIVALSKICDAVLVGGLLPIKIKEQNLEVPKNVMLGKLNEEETDLAPETIDAYITVIKNAKTIIWGGPVGEVQSATLRLLRQYSGQVRSGQEGSLKIAQAIIESGAESIVGGGDTVGFLSENNLLDKFSFISTGGGAMLKFLSEGTLPTIEALG